MAEEIPIRFLNGAEASLPSATGADGRPIITDDTDDEKLYVAINNANVQVGGKAVVAHTTGDGSDHSDVAANTAASHAESHTIASHNDTSATGTELNTLTDGSNADLLHSHAGTSLEQCDAIVDPGGSGDYTTLSAAATGEAADALIGVIVSGSNITEVADIAPKNGQRFIAFGMYFEHTQLAHVDMGDYQLKMSGFQKGVVFEGLYFSWIPVTNEYKVTASNFTAGIKFSNCTFDFSNAVTWSHQGVNLAGQENQFYNCKIAATDLCSGVLKINGGGLFIDGLEVIGGDQTADDIVDMTGLTNAHVYNLYIGFPSDGDTSNYLLNVAGGWDCFFDNITVYDDGWGAKLVNINCNYSSWNNLYCGYADGSPVVVDVNAPGVSINNLQYEDCYDSPMLKINAGSYNTNINGVQLQACDNSISNDNFISVADDYVSISAVNVSSSSDVGTGDIINLSSATARCTINSIIAPAGDVDIDGDYHSISDVILSVSAAFDVRTTKSSFTGCKFGTMTVVGTCADNSIIGCTGNVTVNSSASDNKIVALEGTVSDSGTNTKIGAYSKTVLNHAGNASVYSDINHTNSGAGGTVTLTLTDIAANKEYRFSVMAAQKLVISVGGGITVRIAGQVSADGGNIWSEDIGSVITLQCLTATELYAMNAVGDWDFDTV